MLQYDAVGGALYDPLTGKEYVQLSGMEEYKMKHEALVKDMRHSQLNKLIFASKHSDLRARIIAGETPIYYNPHNQFYYYPVEAIEERYPRFREIIKRTPPLVYDEMDKCFYSQKTREKYVQVSVTSWLGLG